MPSLNPLTNIGDQTRPVWAWARTGVDRKGERESPTNATYNTNASHFNAKKINSCLCQHFFPFSYLLCLSLSLFLSLSISSPTAGVWCCRCCWCWCWNASSHGYLAPLLLCSPAFPFMLLLLFAFMRTYSIFHTGWDGAVVCEHLLQNSHCN